MTINTPPSARRGLAMILVLVVVALATTLGMALLHGGAIQARVVENAESIAQAEYLADSGISIAVNYLYNPALAPTLVTGDAGEVHYPGAADLRPFGEDGGRVDLQITNPEPQRFLIRSTGRTDNATRTLQVLIQVQSEYKIVHAVGHNGTLRFRNQMVANGDVRTDATLQLPFGRGQVRGTTYAGSPGSHVDHIRPSYPTTSAPLYADLQIVSTMLNEPPLLLAYRAYEYDGRLCYADPIIPIPLIPVSGTLQTPDPERNPANVWYATQTITINNLTLDGTLVLLGSTSTLRYQGSSTITAKEGMPAVVVGGNLTVVAAANTHLTVNGLLWIGGDLTATSTASTTCSLTVNGAMLMSRIGNSTDTTFRGPITINYDESKVRLPELTKKNRTITGMSLVQWSGGSNP